MKEWGHQQILTKPGIWHEQNTMQKERCNVEVPFSTSY